MTRPEAVHFSTGAELACHQFDAWHAAMEAVIDVSRSADADPAAGFPASLAAWDLGGLGLVSMRMPGIGHERRWSNVARPAADHWSILLPVSDGRNRPHARRQLHLSALDRPFSGSGSDTYVISCFIPRDLFGTTAAHVDPRRERLGDEGVAGLLIDLLLSLRLRLQEGLVADPAGVQRAILALFAGAFAPSRDALAPTRGMIDVLRQERILRHIRANLGSARLGVDEICRTFQLSRSGLYRMFEGLGGVEATIQRERIDAARRALRGGDTRRIHRIAEAFGFPDPSIFSRAFRRHVGCSPSEIREGASSRAPKLGPLDAFLAGLD
ncbi:MAG: hypothetical protein ABS35_21460 [Kaistia sp. SCN 65-12]|nr:MAG: hypothetical protein ABS35_21460 [Kaistia sp. SCN 65-12]